ncbi:peptidase S10 [Shewanella sp. KX20019]|uniref:S10 family peptidase n=1 Tax=Shewanella sp. KX20019 TaxID=2803864 RepID=UPI00192827DE|nr:peptidase S10 [Shewanella sp. KX20019]QQX81218.1 peptidase S10 [Shewanella sp. KX20019]
MFPQASIVKMLKQAVRASFMLSSSVFFFSATAAETKPITAPIEPEIVVTEHRARINDQKINYQAIAGETILEDSKGLPLASIFSISYLRTDVKDATKRPVTFVFNGGPGSASLWLHMGIFGPKRVVVPGDAIDDGAAPYPLVENEYSMLDESDLVFIDPVGTGFSRALGDNKAADFWGVTEDAKSIAEFMRRWLIEHGRWNSPKYLAGESYGTTRAAALVDELQGGWTDISINGVMLISSILDFSHARYQPGNNQPYIGFLPTMAATAFYHNKVSAVDKAIGLEAFIDAARQFALKDYALALLQGNRLDSETYQDIRQQLARFTGLSENYLDRVNLRVSASRYSKQLLREQDLTVGRLDSRYKGVDYDSGGERTDNDPSGYGIDGAYTAAIHDYIYKDLGIKMTRPFNVLSYEVNRGWNWNVSGKQMHYVNVAPMLGRAQRENKDLRILVANGYFDFATPFFATENTFADNGIDNSRVSMHYYAAGHMMYIEPGSLAQLAQDIRQFYHPKKQ